MEQSVKIKQFTLESNCSSELELKLNNAEERELFNEFSIPIIDLPYSLRLVYVKIVAYIVFSNAESVDDKRLESLFNLMDRFELAVEQKTDLKDFANKTLNSNLDFGVELLKKIKFYTIHLNYNFLICSFLRDIVNVYLGERNLILIDYMNLNISEDIFNLSDEEIEELFSSKSEDSGESSNIKQVIKKFVNLVKRLEFSTNSSKEEIKHLFQGSNSPFKIGNSKKVNPNDLKEVSIFTTKQILQRIITDSYKQVSVEGEVVWVDK
jgi:hypothetical protein